VTASQKYPDDKIILGRYLEPAIDVGSALTMKILKHNGEVVCRSTVRHLTDDEHDDAVHKEMRRAFDLAIQKSHGAATMSDGFPPDALTPEYEMMILKSFLPTQTLTLLIQLHPRQGTTISMRTYR
jgi:hypothetical protein